MARYHSGPTIEAVANYLLLDGHNLAFRSWFALKDAGMSTSSGQETQAVYGFVSMVTRMLADFSPDGLAVAFDRREPTFRDEFVKQYKAGRPSTPEPLLEQIELIRQFVVALGIPALDAIGYEADDILATLATRSRDAGDDVVIVTGDRDVFQLVEDPHIRVMYNRRGVTDYVLYDEAGIIDRTGVPPSEYPLFASLRGDTSDNLPGVPGVGEKTAAKLVSTYHDVDTLFAHLDENTPKLRASLAAAEEQVRTNLRAIPLMRAVPIAEGVGALSPDREALERLFDFLEMRTLKERLFEVLGKAGLGERSTPVVEEPPVRAVTAPESKDELATALAAALKTKGRVGIDVDWEGVPGRSAVAAIAFASPDEGPVVVAAGERVHDDAVSSALAQSGEPAAPRLAGHGLKELVREFLSEGSDVTGVDLDTNVAAYLLDPAQGSASLHDLAQRHGLVAPTGGESGQLDFELLGGEDADAGQFDGVARRADVARVLAGMLADELEKVGELELYDDIERPLVRVLAKMEVTGIGVDVDRLRATNAGLTSEANALESEIHELAGEDFNVNSSTQLRHVLYEKLKLTPGKKTKTGYSTDAQTLEKLRDAHPIVDTLLRYREVEKLRSTYGDGLLAEVGADGRIHASFNQTVARTGRLSSDRPNLHNIPIRSEEGRRIREAFVPAKGTTFLIADYNQIELRVIAHLSGDPGLVAAFAERRDIHATTAARIFGVDPKEVTLAQRSKAKMVSYGLAYGMEAYGLSQRLGVDIGEASAILDSYFDAFPAVRAYMELSVQEARAKGYTETELGRRRYLPELMSDNFRVRQAAERQAMNAGIQGLGADIFKIALVRIDEAFEAAKLGSRLVLQVHDEVLVETPDAEHDETEKIVREAMEQAYPLKVPLEVHLSWGKSWADAK
ncbi:MAG: DNA polymerase I [Acidimicrobiales bacterium]